MRYEVMEKTKNSQKQIYNQNSQKKVINRKFGGSIYLNGKRYWYKVKLPGEKIFKFMPLKVEGGKLATKDYSVACKLAESIWQKAIFKPTEESQNYNGTIASLCTAYATHCTTYYRSKEGEPTRETGNIENALKPLTNDYGSMQVDDFGPLKLIELRGKLINNGKLCRNTINQRINIIRRMFRWAVSRQLVGAMMHHALMTVEALKQYRSEARETEDVKPIGIEHVYAILPYVTKVIADMIQVQLLTGARSSELIIMRPDLIDMSKDIWFYRPYRHKTGHLNHKRVLVIGPKCQKVLKPYLERPADVYCFSPQESHMQSREKYCGKKFLRCNLHDKYTTKTYYNAIQTGIDNAVKAEVKLERWFPHRLRHTAGTKVRSECGRDAARAFLGHTTSKMTDDYAEIDEKLAVEAAQKIG